MTFQEYRDAEGLNASLIKQGKLSMLAMHTAAITDTEPTPAMKFGTLAHSCVLEQAQFSSNIAIWTGGRRQGGKWAEFCDANSTRTILTPDEHGQLMGMSNAVHSNPHAHHIIESTEHEVPLFWDDTGCGKAKCRWDGLSKKVGLEFKTTNARTKAGFLKSAYDLAYSLQFGWYWHGALQNDYADITVYVIGVQQTLPHDVWIFKVPTQILKDGYKEARRIAVLYRCCQASGVYPGEQELIEDWTLPAWAGNDEEVELVIGGKKEVL